MIYLYHIIFKWPLLNLLVFLYETIGFHNLGFAIILLTLLIRFALFPFFHKGAKQQMLMQRIQPKVRKIQEMHKDDREKQTKALMDLYKEHGVNPFSSILLLILQLPILLALYRIFLYGISSGLIAGLYSFVPQPGAVNSIFLGIINLAKPSIPLVLAAAVAQFFQARLAIYRPPEGTQTLSQAEKIARQMAFIGPIVTIAIFYRLPAAVGVYWLVSSLFSIVQQIFVNRHLRKQFGN